MEKYFEEGELSREEILTGLSLGVKEGVITPVCCCAAQPNIGIPTLLDNLVNYMPAASEAKAPKAVDAKTGEPVEIKQDGKFAAQVIKTVVDQFGKYSIVKVYRMQLLPLTTATVRRARSLARFISCAARRPFRSIS